MYSIGWPYHLFCIMCQTDTVLHHTLAHTSGLQLAFCSKCGYTGSTYSRAAFPGDPAQYRALWVLLQE